MTSSSATGGGSFYVASCWQQFISPLVVAVLQSMREFLKFSMLLWWSWSSHFRMGVHGTSSVSSHALFLIVTYFPFSICPCFLLVSDTVSIGPPAFEFSISDGNFYLIIRGEANQSLPVEASGSISSFNRTFFGGMPP